MKYYPRYLALFLVPMALFLNNAYASTVYANVSYSALSVNYPGDPKESNRGTAHASYANVGDAKTDLGHARSSISMKKYYGVAHINNHFRIDDLTLSYIGYGTTQSVINGSIHLSYAGYVGKGQGLLKLGLDSGRGIDWEYFDTEGNSNPINSSGVVARSRNFTVGEVFSLAFYGEMSIAARRDDNWMASGGYRVELGGSPVFNLPKGYVVNSADGRIVNNYYTGLGAPSAVPVPAAIWLMGSGLVGLLGVRRRKT